jgi:hypothetical protein
MYGTFYLILGVFVELEDNVLPNINTGCIHQFLFLLCETHI